MPIARIACILFPHVHAHISICDRHCTSKIAINISIFHLGSYTRRARNCPDAERSAPPIFEATAHRAGPSCELTCSLCSSGIVLQV